MEMKNSCDVDIASEKMKKSENNIISEVFSDYCSSTSLHGVRYFGEKDKPLSEKIWWIIVFILSFIMCSLLIAKTWIKWQNNPVILSFEQEQTSVWEIPFPAVTICPINKVKQSEYNYTELFRTRDNISAEDYKKFWDVSMICNLEQYELSFNCTLNTTDQSAIKNILEVAPSIHDIFGEIQWQKKDVSNVFAEQLTQEGLCFTFNSFSQQDMYTEEINNSIVYINHNIKNNEWILEHGYTESSQMDGYPRRTAKDGYGSGLSITLLSLKFDNDYVCGEPTSGYKIILHNSAETPRPGQQYFLIPPNRQTTLIVKPELTTTSDNLLSMAPTARKCYFSHEKYLRFYNIYTQNNCRSECVHNVTEWFCGCVPFYMPHSNATLICGFGKIECIQKVENKILEFEMFEKRNNMNETIRHDSLYKIFDICNCLPSCSDLQFTAETSGTDINPIKKIVASGVLDELGSDIIAMLETGAVSFTKVDIFFKESQFLALHRSELYGQTDFLANCGGLLGLFMGFSILSLVEIIYFSTIRLWFQLKKRRKNEKYLQVKSEIYIIYH